MKFSVKTSTIIEQGILVLILTLVFLYDVLVDSIGFLDEFVGLISLIIFLWHAFVIGKLKLYRNEYYIIILLITILFIGIISNFSTHINGHTTSLVAILSDIIVFFKAFIAYLAVRLITGLFDAKKVLKSLSKYVERIFYLLLLLVLLDLFFNIFPHHPRYGIYSFELFFQHTSRYAFTLAFVFLILLPKYYKKNKAFLLLILILGFLSLRVKFIGFMVLAILIIFLGKRLFKVPKSVFIITISIFSLFLLWLFWGTFKLYFTFTSLEDAWSRAVVLYYSFIIGNDYFPLGSGFGTFSSYYSGLYYSWTYDLYNINNVYGISRAYWGFIADQYWPMILGQFGYFGLLSMILILYNYFKLFFNNLKKNINNPKYYLYLSAILGLLMLIIDSTSDAIFTQQRGVVVFMYFALVINTVSQNDKK